MQPDLRSVGSHILYIDMVGGVAGDMLLAALIDAGASIELVREALRIVGLDRVRLEEREVSPAGLRAKQLDVFVGELLADSKEAFEHDKHHGHRHYSEIKERIENATELPDDVRRTALRAFKRLGEAEARAHGVPIEDVHFHEVGGDDAIADIVGVATAIHDLRITEVVSSPVPLGRGLTRGGHGPIPLPGPATLNILSGAILQETPIEGETVTPTGAALLSALSDAYGPIPAMVLERVGVGAGHKEWPDRPNIVRAMIGRGVELSVQRSREDCVIETNLDDMNPEHMRALEQALFAAGAFDVWNQPIMMKKGRQGTTVSALAPLRLRDAIISAFFLHSTTLGLRVIPMTRHLGHRAVEPVSTEFGEVHVKISERPEGPALVMPEYDDCERIAAEQGVSVRAVFEAAQRAVWAAAEIDTKDLPEV